MTIKLPPRSFLVFARNPRMINRLEFLPSSTAQERKEAYAKLLRYHKKEFTEEHFRDPEILPVWFGSFTSEGTILTGYRKKIGKKNYYHKPPALTLLEPRFENRRLKYTGKPDWLNRWDLNPNNYRVARIPTKKRTGVRECAQLLVNTFGPGLVEKDISDKDRYSLILTKTKDIPYSIRVIELAVEYLKKELNDEIT